MAGPKTQAATSVTAAASSPASWQQRFAISSERVLGLAGKELYSYFYSPIAYVVMIIYLAFAGWFFFSRFFLFGQLEMRGYFDTAPALLLFLSPAITMRLLAEEFNTGSYEMLMTLPLTELQMLLGKYLAALGFLAVTIGLTLLYPLTISTLGSLDWGAVGGGFFGLLLLGASYLSIGLFTSAITRNQIVAFILGFALSCLFFLADKILMFVPAPLIGLFEYLGVEYHFQALARGVLDTKDLIYFGSLITFFIAATRWVLERRK